MAIAFYLEILIKINNTTKKNLIKRKTQKIKKYRKTMSFSSSPAIPVGWSSSFDKSVECLNKSWPHIALKVGKIFQLFKSFMQ